MANRFKRRESVRAGFRRIAAEQFDGIRADLAGQDGPPDIHNARRRCKFTRALLRLVRAGLKDSRFYAENIRLRDLARSLSAARDAQVRLRTFELLLALPGAPHAAPYAPMYEWLHTEAAKTRAKVLASPALAQARSAAHRAQARFARITLTRGGWRLLAAGLHRSYRATRRAFRAAVDAPSDAAHHEWRKRVKDLWNHVRLLRNVHPRKLGALGEQLDALGELLGDDHDLAVLHAHLTAPAAPPLDAADLAMLEALIAHRRHSLLRVAQKLGVLACGEKPRVLLDRVKEWWRAWRK